MTQRPLISIILSFVLGILLASFAPVLFLLPLVLLVPTLLLFALRRRSQYGVLAFCLIAVLLGFWRVGMANHIAQNDISRFAPAKISVTSVLVSDVESTGLKGREKWVRLAFKVGVEGVQTKAFEEAQSAEGTLQTYLTLKRDSNQTLPTFGTRVRLFGELELPQGQRNPGGFDYAHYLNTQGVTAVLASKQWEALPEEVEGNPLLKAVFALRKRLLASAQRGLSPELAGILNGILFGERTGISGELRNDFERTGTIHILATAGLHVGIMAGLLLALFKHCRISRRNAILLTLASLVLYAFLAGGRPAVVRAVVIGGVYLFARIVEREPDWWNATAFSALILLVLNPNSLLEAGFQLSYATVITLVLFMPYCQKQVQKIKERLPQKTYLQRGTRSAVDYLLICFVVSLVAQLGTLPLIATYFYHVSFTSVLANLMVVPLVTPILALGFTTSILGAIYPLLSAPFVEMLKTLLKTVLVLVRYWGELGAGGMNVPPPSVWLIILYYGVLWSIGWRLYHKHPQQEEI